MKIDDRKKPQKQIDNFILWLFNIFDDFLDYQLCYST